jgi:hypothetical protein
MFRTVSRGPNPRFCSTKCSGDSRRQRPAELPCAECGRPFSTTGRKGNPRFCSRGCKGAAQRAQRLKGAASRQCDNPGCARLVSDKPLAASRAGQRRYCSVECQRVGRRQRVTVRCAGPGCERSVESFPSVVTKRRRLYCSEPCYHASMRTPPRTVNCEYCGQTRPMPKGTRRARYCSRQCSGKAHRTSVTLPCARSGCTNTCERKQAELVGGRQHYCSIACRAMEQRRWPRMVCAQCGREFARDPRQPGHRHCSRACRLAGGSRVVKCRRERCRNTRVVPLSRLRAGRGRYCSKSCQVKDQRTRRKRYPRCGRRGCLRIVRGSPAQFAQGLKYCSRRCRSLARKPWPRFDCSACGVEFPVPPWRYPDRYSGPRYHSRACARQAPRHRRRPLALVERNQLIWSLHEQGWKVPTIRGHITKQWPEQWWPTPAAIRQVISREARARQGRIGGREQTVTLPDLMPRHPRERVARGSQAGSQAAGQG